MEAGSSTFRLQALIRPSLLFNLIIEQKSANSINREVHILLSEGSFHQAVADSSQNVEFHSYSTFSLRLKVSLNIVGIKKRLNKYENQRNSPIYERKKDISELEGSLMFLLSFIKRGMNSMKYSVTINTFYFCFAYSKCLSQSILSRQCSPCFSSWLISYIMFFFFKCLKFKYEISWKKVLKGVTKSRMIQLPTIDVYLFV